MGGRPYRKCNESACGQLRIFSDGLRCLGSGSGNVNLVMAKPARELRLKAQTPIFARPHGSAAYFLLLRFNCKKKLLLNAQIGTLSPCLKLWSGKSRGTSGAS